MDYDLLTAEAIRPTGSEHRCDRESQSASTMGQSRGRSKKTANLEDVSGKSGVKCAKALGPS